MLFLPQGYKVPSSKGNYFKPPAGKSRVRILDQPILGYVGWTLPDPQHKNGQPVRRKLDDFPPGSIDPDKAVKHFWAVPVWNYSALRVQVWEITQATIQREIETLTYNQDWLDPRRYDLTIERSGEKLETKYSVVPAPPKALPAEAREAWQQARQEGFDLTRLYNNGDAFGTGKAEDMPETYFGSEPIDGDSDTAASTAGEVAEELPF